MPVKTFFHAWILLFSLWTCSLTSAACPGFIEGHVTIGPLPPVELADGAPAKTPPEAYEHYPLVILRADRRTEVMRLTADAQGNYRAALPPGDYILDVVGRAPKRTRAKPQPFSIVPGKTVRVDMQIDTGIR